MFIYIINERETSQKKEVVRTEHVETLNTS